jgi:hypothetical protein
MLIVPSSPIFLLMAAEKPGFEYASWPVGAYVDREDPSVLYVFDRRDKFSAIRVGGSWKPSPGLTIGELAEDFKPVKSREGVETALSEARRSLSADKNWTFGSWDGDPVVLVPGKARVFVDGSWQPANSSVVGMEARVMSEATFRAKFPGVEPPVITTFDFGSSAKGGSEPIHATPTPPEKDNTKSARPPARSPTPSEQAAMVDRHQLEAMEEILAERRAKNHSSAPPSKEEDAPTKGPKNSPEKLDFNSQEAQDERDTKKMLAGIKQAKNRSSAPPSKESPTAFDFGSSAKGGSEPIKIEHAMPTPPNPENMKLSKERGRLPTPFEAEDMVNRHQGEAVVEALRRRQAKNHSFHSGSAVSEGGSEPIKIEHLPDLELGNERFRYCARWYEYRLIDGITFDATHTKHSINGVPTGSSYTSKLILHLANGDTVWIGQEHAYFSSKQKLRMEAVWKASEIFSDLTFDQRLKKYDVQLRTKDFFSHGRYQFRRGGEVFKDSRYLFNVKEDNITVTLEPFKINFVAKKSALQKAASFFVNLDESIDISRDRDCFLYMYRAATGHHWAKEHYRVPKAKGV